MDCTVHEEIYKGYRIKIFNDDSPFDPRKNDNLGKMVCFHRNYDLGDEHNMTIDQLKTLIKKDNIYSLPLYLYDHSGITMNTTGFSCPWDSGQVGVIFASKKAIQKNFKVRKVTQEHIWKAMEILEAEVKEYDDYITGNCYGFVIEDENANEIESVWGFIGDYKGCVDEAKVYIDNASEIQLQLPLEGTEGQDRESYSDDQDRKSYNV